MGEGLVRPSLFDREWTCHRGAGVRRMSVEPGTNCLTLRE